MITIPEDVSPFSQIRSTTPETSSSQSSGDLEGTKISPATSEKQSIVKELDWNKHIEEATQKEQLFRGIRLEKSTLYSPRPFLAPKKISEAFVKSLQYDFDEYCDAQAEKIITECKIYDPTIETKIYEKLDSIKRQTSFAKLLEQNPEQPLNQIIQQAHCDLLRSLYELRKTVAQPEPTVTGTSSPSFMIPAPPVENIVFSGGGAKGAGYLGFLKAAEEAGSLEHLQRVAGSSIGAVTASFVAVGMSAKEIHDAFLELTSLENGLAILTQKATPELKEAITYENHRGLSAPTEITAPAISDFINKKINNSIASYFSTITKETISSKTSFTPEEEQSLLALHDSFSSKSPTLVTFAQLSLLHKLDPKFKELTVTGFDTTTKQTIYFNAKNSPNSPLVQGIRASIALPSVLRAITTEEGRVIADGGISSNVPTEAFEEHPTEKTWALSFQEGFVETVHAPTPRVADPKSRKIKDASKANRNPEMHLNLTSDNKKLHDKGPNTLIIHHGNLKMTSIPWIQEVEAAALQSELHTWEQLLTRQNQGISYSIKEMPAQKLENLLLDDILPKSENNDTYKEIASLIQTELGQR